VCESKNVGRGSGVLSGPASCLAQRHSYSKFGVLNIAGAAVIPFIIDWKKSGIFGSTFAMRLLLELS